MNEVQKELGAAFLEAVKNRKVLVTIANVSRNGLKRKFRFAIIHNDKIIKIPADFFSVGKAVDYFTLEVEGAGMDMVWYALIETCEKLSGNNMSSQINLDCSYYTIM